MPPPAPIPPPTNYALQAFDEAIDVLKRLMTKPAADFVGTTNHYPTELDSVADFIRAVMKARRQPADAAPPDDGLDIPEKLRRKENVK